MYALDFEYDGRYLSDYGFVICNFGGASDMDVVSAGSKITFNTVPMSFGKRFSLTGTHYEECIQATFQICKNPELYDDLQISRDEYTDIMRWLNRREFLKFRMLDEWDTEQETCAYEASFNISKIMVNRVLYGLELTMETNKPFGDGQELSVSWDIQDTSKTYILRDMSDEIGYSYPSMEITVKQGGTLSIHNALEGCTMTLKNCQVGETIRIEGVSHTIISSQNNHRIQDDFNFEFLRIGNTINGRDNRITVSLPCRLKMWYSPVVKNSPT
jgi:hypothetical protein